MHVISAAVFVWSFLQTAMSFDAETGGEPHLNIGFGENDKNESVYKHKVLYRKKKDT